MTRSRAAIAIPLALAACSVQDRPEMRWIGAVTPVANPARCPPSRGVLILRGPQFTFAPDEGTWVLAGTTNSAALNAKRARPGADHKPFETELHAEWTDTAVTGTYTTPLCDFVLDLKRY